MRQPNPDLAGIAATVQRIGVLLAAGTALAGQVAQELGSVVRLGDSGGQGVAG